MNESDIQSFLDRLTNPGQRNFWLNDPVLMYALSGQNPLPAPGQMLRNKSGPSLSTTEDAAFFPQTLQLRRIQGYSRTPAFFPAWKSDYEENLKRMRQIMGGGPA